MSESLPLFLRKGNEEDRKEGREVKEGEAFPLPTADRRLAARKFAREAALIQAPELFFSVEVIMTPSQDSGAQGSALCSDRRSSCDRSRRRASRFLAGSSLRLKHGTVHRKFAGG